MQVRLLGPVEVSGSSGDAIALPGGKLRGLVAMLALDAGRTVPADRLIAGLWGEQDLSGPNVLQVLVSKLRRLLVEAGEANCVSTQPAGYRLDIEAAATDVSRFEALLQAARAAGDDTAHVVELLDDALGLWQGVALWGVPDTELTAAVRARLHELRNGAADDLIEARLALGQHDRVIPELEALLAEEPLREGRWGLLVRALYGSGRQAEAVRAVQRARQILIDQIGIEPGDELRRLEAAVLAQDASVLGSATATPAQPIGSQLRRRGNARHPTGTCFGRAGEIGALVELCGHQRLVTLVGPGGVGKTRLAMEVCLALAPDVPDGVWWIELASARSEADVLGAIQRSLGMDVVASDASLALDAVCVNLADRSALLVVDNCEHLLAEVAMAVDELLARCGRLRILATSREGLDVPAERLFRVEPLRPADAVELFAARTSDSAGHERDEARSAAVMSEICERLDRLPLALELAAARTRHLSLDEIRDRLSDRFELLRDGTRTVQAHQRNLRGVADWSYELLDAEERIVFERLSVFADGATVDAARRVCGVHGVDTSSVEFLLHRLVDKSLVVPDRSGARTRFRLLQTLSDYAGERLGQRDDRAAALRDHAEWVLGLAHTVDFGSSTDGAVVAAVHDEDVAVRDAIEWSLVADPVLALRICDALSWYWFGTMRVTTGWEMLSMALDAAGSADPPLRAAAQAWAGLFTTMVQDLDEARRHTTEAVEFERQLGDVARLGRLCFAAALAAGYTSDPQAPQWIAEARAHFAAAGLTIGLGHVSFAEGAMHLMYGEIPAAATSLRDSISVFAREHEHLGLILAVSRLGELAWRLGDVELFAEMHADLLELGRAGRSNGVIAGATARLALAHLVGDDVETAEQLARTALSISIESFMPVINGYALRSAGLVNLRLGHAAEGRAQLHAAIEAFGQGAGGVGVGQAAMCWIDLSVSYASSGELEAARHAAKRSVDTAIASGDTWVIDQTATHLAHAGEQAPTV